MLRFFLLLFSVCSVAFAQAQNYRDAFARAEGAYQTGNFRLYQQHLMEANRLRPNHQTIMYHLAKAHALNDQLDSSCFYLNKVIGIDAVNFDLSHPELARLEALPCFQSLEKKQLFLNTPYMAADTLQVINNPLFHVEGITFDRSRAKFLVSSINNRNVYWVDKAGNLSAVLKDSLPVAPTGISVDSEGDLWVASMGIAEAGLQEDDAYMNRAFLYKIDLSKRVILQKWEVEDDEQHLFGDVFVSSKNEVFVSDSKQNEIYQLIDNRLRPLLNSTDLISLQGITKIDNFLLLADYVKGLYVFNLITKELLPIQSSSNLSLKGIDGMYAHEGNLIAIQNGVQPNRVIALTLNKSFQSIVNLEILEKNHPAFGEPTLGIVLNHGLYFIANSFWEKNKDGILQKEESTLPVILKLGLAENMYSTSIVLQEQVEILDDRKNEALYFYKNNWAAFRAYAKQHGYVSNYSLNVERANDGLIWLETEFADSVQLNAIKLHFKEWVKGSNGPKLLNELQPSSFRKTLSSSTQEVLIDSKWSSNRISPACQGSPYQAFNFWIGDWEVYDTLGVYLGHNTISQIEGGCGLQERWTAASAAYTGSSYNYFNRSDLKWHQVWVDNQGIALTLSGGKVGKAMVMQSIPNDSIILINKIIWTPISEIEVTQVWEVSEDGGNTWKQVFYGVYKKQ